jgi:hypothetical protein
MSKAYAVNAIVFLRAFAGEIGLAQRHSTTNYAKTIQLISPFNRIKHWESSRAHAFGTPETQVLKVVTMQKRFPQRVRAFYPLPW